MEQFTETLAREYFNALYNLQDGNKGPMDKFKSEHFELYQLVNANYHKRKKLRDNIKAMKSVSPNGCLCFGALTFDGEHDAQRIDVKRKQASRHLNKFMSAYLFVEEYGEEYGRYHIHFIGLLRDDVRYLDFCGSWHSRAQIEKVISIKRAVNYLTDYVVKQAPRIRRNKVLVDMFNHYQKSESWKRYGFEKSLAKEELERAVISLAMGL